jgi:hypothetical protein
VAATMPSGVEASSGVDENELDIYRVVIYFITKM